MKTPEAPSARSSAPSQRASKRTLKIDLRLPQDCSAARARRALKESLGVTPGALLSAAIGDALWEQARRARKLPAR